MMRPFLILLTICLVAVATPRTGAQDELVIPTAFPESRYEAEWEHSAFHREVIRVIEEQITSNFARNVVLEGVVDDAVVGPIAFLRNKETNDSYMVTREQQEGVPFYIESASQTADPLNTTVRITDGTESATITFDKTNVMKAVQKPAIVADSRPSNEKVEWKFPGSPEQQPEKEGSETEADQQTDSQNREIKATLARPPEFRPSGGGGENAQKPQKVLENKDRRRIIPSPK